MNQKEYELIGQVFFKRRQELKRISACTTVDEHDRDRIAINAKFTEMHLLKYDLGDALAKEYSNFDRIKFNDICMRGEISSDR